MTRQATTANQHRVATNATTKAKASKDGTKPGASRATLAAGFSGMPVTMAIQITHTRVAHRLKNSTENQSISALTLRLRVGSANAASTDSAGRASSITLSDPLSQALAVRISAVSSTGSPTWACRKCLRQRHNVHSTNGHRGHVNHASILTNEVKLNGKGASVGAGWDQGVVHHKMHSIVPAPHAMASFNVWVARRVLVGLCCAVACGCNRYQLGTAAETHSASQGMPDRPMTNRPIDQQASALVSTVSDWCAIRALPYSTAARLARRKVSGVASCDNCTSPRLPISASRPESAMARA